MSWVFYYFWLPDLMFSYFLTSLCICLGHFCLVKKHTATSSLVLLQKFLIFFRFRGSLVSSVKSAGISFSHFLYSFLLQHLKPESTGFAYCYVSPLKYKLIEDRKFYTFQMFRTILTHVQVKLNNKKHQNQKQTLTEGVNWVCLTLFYTSWAF